jgi:hypothetical protein
LAYKALPFGIQSVEMASEARKRRFKEHKLRKKERARQERAKRVAEGKARRKKEWKEKEDAKESVRKERERILAAWFDQLPLGQQARLRFQAFQKQGEEEIAKVLAQGVVTSWMDAWNLCEKRGLMRVPERVYPNGYDE